MVLTPRSESWGTAELEEGLLLNLIRLPGDQTVVEANASLR